MNSILGSLAVAVGFAAAVTGAVVCGLAAYRHDGAMMRLGRRFVWVVLASSVGAVAVMETALLSHDFSLQYVADNGSLETPPLFTVASLWAALAGSILLWTFILTAHLAFASFRWRRLGDDPLLHWATAVGLGAAAFFFGLMLGPANPFHRVHGLVPTDGVGPNPLLQNHPLMAFHPPFLYVGYVGFTVPFALAIAALVSGRVGEQWLRLTRTATLIAWSALTAGIVLGAWWSYQVLGWGGYWAWDPVENAALIPWFTATAYLHSVIVQERRGMLRVWNLSLLIATYCLTILGTFLTRSGVVNSVHAFTQSAVGPTLIAYLAAVALLALGLLAWRGDRLHAVGRIDSPLSREAAFLGNNLVLTALATVVVTGTVYPLVAQAVSGQQLSIGEPYFDKLGAPLGLALLFLMAVAPLLPYRAVEAEALRQRLRGPVTVAVLTMLALVATGVRGVEQVLAFGLASMATWSIATVVVRAVALRHRSVREPLLRSVTRTLSGNRRRYGGLLVHLGVVVVAVGLTASHNYSTHRDVEMARGQTVAVDGYHVTYLGTATTTTPQKTTVAARVLVDHGTHPLGIYTPALSVFPGATQAIGTPSVGAGLTRDVYLTLTSSPNQRGHVSIGVFINPLVTWLWVGGLTMVLGAVITGLPRRRRRPSSPPVDSTVVRSSEPVPTGAST